MTSSIRSSESSPFPEMRFFSRRQPPQRAAASATRRVRELEVATARLVREGFAGEYHAAFHGRGLEFSQVREYQPGDDIRTIDWNVTARSGLPHVKQFIEERDLTVMVLLDVSGSMAFGSLDRRKIDLATELAAVLGFAAVENGDRVGLLAFRERVARFIPPKRGRRHVQQMVQAGLELTREPGGVADLEGAVRLLERLLVKRSVVVVISDFLGGWEERTLRRLESRHDVIAFVVSDPREEYLPRRGLARLIDSETGSSRVVDLGRNAIDRGAGSRIDRLKQSFRRLAVDSVAFSTAAAYDRTLLRFFEGRISRRR